MALPPFARAWRQFVDLPHVNKDPYTQSTIADLVFAASLEVDQYEAGLGESIATKREIERIKRFIAKWQGVN